MNIFETRRKQDFTRAFCHFKHFFHYASTFISQTGVLSWCHKEMNLRLLTKLNVAKYCAVSPLFLHRNYRFACCGSLQPQMNSTFFRFSGNVKQLEISPNGFIQLCTIVTGKRKIKVLWKMMILLFPFLLNSHRNNIHAIRYVCGVVLSWTDSGKFCRAGTKLLTIS